MAKITIIEGMVFGKLTVIREGKPLKLPSGQTNRAIRCRCDCGKVKNIRLLHLVRGRIRSCGCLSGEKHNMTGGKLYRVWTAMKERCYREGYIDQHRYKNRGIKICKSWLNSFVAFKNWALKNGWKPRLQIDRINNNGNYKPSNCRFVTNVINVNNRENTLMVSYNGKKVSLSLLLMKKNKTIHYAAIYGRIKRGWDEQKAVDTKIKEGNYKRNIAAQIVG